MAQRTGGQIPLDDEPMDIDLGDLPSEAEFAESEAEAAVAPEDADPAMVAAGTGAPADQSLLAIFQLYVTLVALLYLLIGLGTGVVMAFRGASAAGISALTHPGFYLLILFWPVTIWKLVFNQF